MTTIQIKIDDLGYAAIINVDYVHNSEVEAKEFFNCLYVNLASLGFNFDNRLFYKLGSATQIHEDLRVAVEKTSLSTGLLSKKFIRSVHLVPLSQFHDITHTLCTGPAV